MDEELRRLERLAAASPSCGRSRRALERARRRAGLLPEEPRLEEFVRAAGNEEAFALVRRLVAGELAPGEVVLLEGPSGVGKSFLLRALAAARESGGRPTSVVGGEELSRRILEAVGGGGLTLESGLVIVDDAGDFPGLDLALTARGLVERGSALLGSRTRGSPRAEQRRAFLRAESERGLPLRAGPLPPGLLPNGSARREPVRVSVEPLPPAGRATLLERELRRLERREGLARGALGEAPRGLEAEALPRSGFELAGLARRISLEAKLARPSAPV